MLLAEEHPAVRAVMRELIDAQAGMRVVAEAADARSALDLACQTGADVAVVDMALPGAGRRAVIGELRRLCPASRVVATSMHQDRHFVAMAIRAGASGFLLKDCAEGGLVGAIQAAAARGRASHMGPWRR
ncbi:MAG: response regulator transcription factor [Candidatus Latescibacterota bacterium]